MDMDSVPPATMTSAEPERIRSRRARWLQAEEQKRLTVIALVSTGAGAESGDGATFMPFRLPAWRSEITSSISLRPGGTGRALLDGKGGKIVGAAWRGASLCRRGRREYG